MMFLPSGLFLSVASGCATLHHCNEQFLYVSSYIFISFSCVVFQRMKCPALVYTISGYTPWLLSSGMKNRAPGPVRNAASHWSSMFHFFLARCSWACPISTVHFDLLFSCSLSLGTRALNYCIPVTSKIRNTAMYILASQSIQWQGQRRRMMIGRSLLFKKGNRYLPS